MSFRERGTQGFTNDTTQVEVVPAIRKLGVRHVIKNITIYNPNQAASKDILVSLLKDGTSHTFYHETLAQDGSKHVDEVIVLDHTDETIVIELETSATLQIHWTASYAEIDDTE